MCVCISVLQEYEIITLIPEPAQAKIFSHT